jgi:hypothetical protein
MAPIIKTNPIATPIIGKNHVFHRVVQSNPRIVDNPVPMMNNPIIKIQIALP